MESSRNPHLCAPVGAQGVGRGCAAFMHRQLSTSSTGRSANTCALAVTCDIAESGLWIPRGVPVESSRNPHRYHQAGPACEQLGESGGTTRGQLEDGMGTTSLLHSHRRFILESPQGHPHATGPPDLRIRPKSTDSTVPTTTSVLLLERILLKQGVWKLGWGGSSRAVVHSQAGKEERGAAMGRKRPGGSMRSSRITRVPFGCRLVVRDSWRGRHSSSTPLTHTAHGFETRRGQIGRWSLRA